MTMTKPNTPFSAACFLDSMHGVLVSVNYLVRPATTILAGGGGGIY